MDSDELAQRLSAFGSNDKYRVDRVLKSSPHERTEVVSLIAADGTSTGPYLRKTFQAGSGLGVVYGHILDAQKAGARFPSMPRVLECYEKDGESFVVTEYLDGVSLRDYSGPDGRRLFLEVCNAVQALHERFRPSVIHRDIKPDNVMVCDGHAMLVDLGVSRVFREGGDGASGLPPGHDTRPFATRDYAPPEQFGFGQTDVRSDVYSLGMLLSFVVFGKDPDSALRSAVSQGPQAVMALGASPSEANAIARACAFDPKDRFASVAELVACLQSPGLVAPAAMPVSPSHEASRASDIAGIVWDCLVAFTWLLFLAASISLVVNPPEEMAAHPVWFRVLEYVGVVMSLLGIGFAAILDYRPLRKRIPPLAKLKRWHVVVAAVGVFLLFVLVFGLTNSVLQSSGVIA